MTASLARQLRVVVIIALLIAPSAADTATNLRWSLQLGGNSNELIEVVVDTKALPSNAVIDSATFVAKVRHAPGVTDSLNLSYLDGQLRALTSGHVYRRRFRHSFAQASSVGSSAMQVQVRAAGDKADGMLADPEPPPQVSQSQVQPSGIGPADVDIAPANGNAAAAAGARFVSDRKAFRKAMLAQVAAQAGPQQAASRRVYSLASAPIDPTIGKCMDYANRAVDAFKQARAKGCNVGSHRWSGNFSHHFEWCMGAPAAEPQQETSARAAELNSCAH